MPFQKAITSIDSAHKELHEGHLFVCTHQVSVNAGADFDLVIKTPVSKRFSTHVNFSIEVAGMFLLTLFDGSAVINTSDGTALPTFCRNRQIVSVARTIFTHTPTYGVGGSAGSAIWTWQFGFGTGAASRDSNARSENEWILANSVTMHTNKYVFRMTNNDTAAKILSIECNFYELEA